MVQDGSWGRTDPEITRVDVVVQGTGCRKCLELSFTYIALHESGTCQISYLLHKEQIWTVI